MNNVLSPRNIGGIIGETFGIYGRNFLRLLAIVAIVEVGLGILGTILTLSAIVPAIMGGGTITSLVPFIVIGIILVVGTIIGYPLMTGALIHAVSEQHFHQPVSIGRAYRYAWGRIGVEAELACGGDADGLELHPRRGTVHEGPVGLRVGVVREGVSELYGGSMGCC